MAACSSMRVVTFSILMPNLLTKGPRNYFHANRVHRFAVNRMQKHQDRFRLSRTRKGGAIEVFLEEKIYSELYRSRRLEAANSVLIHFPKLVDAAEDDLKEHVCSLVDAKHVFTFHNDGVYALCELKNRENVENLLTSVTFNPAKETIPVATRMLTCTDLPTRFTQLAVNSRPRPPPSVPIQNTLCKCTDLSHQIRTLHQRDQLSDLAARLRFFVCSTFEDMLTSIFPQCNVLPFGSSVNGFGKDRGDLDMTLSLNPAARDGVNGQKGLEHPLRFTGRDHQSVTDRQFAQTSLATVGYMIDTFMPACDRVTWILQARVPIVRFHQTAADLSCDMSFCDLTGVRMSYLLHRCARLHPSVPALVSCVREWCRVLRVTHDSHPGPWFTNFMITMLVLHYLQTVHLLPPFRRILNEDGGESFISSYQKDHEGDLFMGFLRNCVDTPFHEKAISLLDGDLISKSDGTPLFILNPLDVDHNIAKIVSKSELQRFVALCERTLDFLEYADGQSKQFWGLAEVLTASFCKRISHGLAQRKRLNVADIMS